MANPYNKAHLHLIHHMLDLGCSITVFDGEESQCKLSTSFTTIQRACESTDESWLHIFNADNEKVGTAFIVNGLENDEIVADFSDNDLLNAWNKAYQSDLSGKGL